MNMPKLHAFFAAESHLEWVKTINTFHRQLENLREHALIDRNDGGFWAPYPNGAQQT